MDTHTLNAIAQRAFENVEADAMLVLYNTNKGVKIIPMWEYSADYETESDMRSELENWLVSALIEFSDTSSGECIGTYAMEYDGSYTQPEHKEIKTVPFNVLPLSVQSDLIDKVSSGVLKL